MRRAGCSASRARSSASRCSSSCACPSCASSIEHTSDASAEVQLPHGPRALIRAARTWGRAGRVLLLEDVTQVRRLETVRRDFVANVSHELRTPVAVIRANAETLLAGAKDDPQMATKLIDGLHRNAERLARILADLLDLSRLDAGQYRLELAPTSVKRGHRAVADRRRDRRRRRASVTVVVDDPRRSSPCAPTRRRSIRSSST